MAGLAVGALLVADPLEQAALVQGGAAAAGVDKGAACGRDVRIARNRRQLCIGRGWASRKQRLQHIQLAACGQPCKAVGQHALAQLKQVAIKTKVPAAHLPPRPLNVGSACTGWARCLDLTCLLQGG